MKENSRAFHFHFLQIKIFYLIIFPHFSIIYFHYLYSHMCDVLSIVILIISFHLERKGMKEGGVVWVVTFTFIIMQIGKTKDIVLAIILKEAYLNSVD